MYELAEKSFPRLAGIGECLERGAALTSVQLNVSLLP